MAKEPKLGSIAKENGYVESGKFSGGSSFNTFDQASGNSGSGASGGTVRDIGHGLTCNCGGTHSVTPNRDGSMHVNHHIDGGSCSCDVAKDGTVSGWHGHLYDKGEHGGPREHLIIERKR